MPNDPYKYFRIEARELLDQLGKGMLDLEKSPSSSELVHRLLRYAHTLKGAARVVKQTEIADQAHSIEDVLAAFRDEGAAPGREGVDTVLKRLDAIGTSVSQLGQTAEKVADAPPRPLPEQSLRTLHADVGEMDALINGVAEAHVQLATLRRGFGNLERLQHLQELLVDHLRSPRAGRATNGAGEKAVAIAEELGSLVTSLAGSMGVGVEQVDRELRQVREAAERLRLLPVGLMFNVLERTARDAGQSLGKRVAFETKGGDVRLDAHVLGVVQNALVQAVRNAVAHGLESESVRSAAGKPAEGRVAIEVVRRANRVSFVCRDDGGGVDLDAVRRAAQRRGILSAEVQALGSEELLKMLLKGGISTSGTITEVSGRGVGLDVVREAARGLGGEVNVRSEPGKGTAFEIVVPVSLASLDALLVEVDDQTAVIPVDAVRRTLRVSAAEIARTAEGESLVLEGKVIPFALLSRSLRVGPQTPVSVSSAWSAVVVESGGRLAAIGVDRLLGTENVVLRPLPRLCPTEPVIAGASLDAEGNPLLVLDPEALVASVRRASPVVHAVAATRRPILVVDDSLTTRMLEQSILESAGYDVDVAVSGEEGLKKAHERRYDLMLVDVEMPGIDGFEVITRLRADPELKDLPAILVTSRNAPEDRRRGEEVGAHAYIVKSEFDQKELLGRLRRLVGE